MDRLLSLDDVRTRDPEVAGAKASKLARARSAGMPVLPGWVLPAGESADAMRAGAEAWLRSGSAAAFLAVIDVGVAAGLRRRLAAIAGSEGTLIVRSSTPLDADARWSGAFATYLDVTRVDLPAAIRGCWASAFTKDVSGRGERLGVRPWEFGIAVLLQPYKEFEIGGTAALSPEGTATITVGPGGPAGIVGGRRDGAVVEIAPDGGGGDDLGPCRADHHALLAVATLLRRIQDEMGDNAIEWGATAGDVVLLQSGLTVAEPATRSRKRRLAASPSNAARRLAAAADRCPAPLGDAWVLPWALGLDELPPTPTLVVEDVHTALEAVRKLAQGLAGEAWGASGAAAEAEAAAVLRAALGPHPGPALERLAQLRSVDPAAAARVLGLIDAVGRRLAGERRLPHPVAVWRLSPIELEHATTREASVRSGPDRWEPFVFDVVERAGDAKFGVAAAPGIGAGRPIAVHGPSDVEGIEPRRVLALARPIPHVAPLVWGCAGIVCAGGSTGAHLFEVARSLGVPAVVGVDLMRVGSDALVAVDGNDGCVTTWKPSLDERSRRTGA